MHAQVITWYGSHHTSDFVFDLIGGLAVLFLVLFAVALARQVRTGDRWLAHGALGGAVFGGAGFLVSVGFDTVLAHDHNHLTAASAQTLNLLNNDFFLPIAVGFALFGIQTGLAVVVGRILPKWMGWVMFAFGLACLAGPAGFFGVLAALLWVLVAGTSGSGAAQVYFAGYGPRYTSGPKKGQCNTSPNAPELAKWAVASFLLSAVLTT